MKKVLALFVVFFVTASLAANADCECSYRQQKKMLHNRKMIKNKVINAQVKGKMLAIQELASNDYCNDPIVKAQIVAYQKQIVDLTNQKMCLKDEYKKSLKELKAKKS